MSSSVSSLNSMWGMSWWPTMGLFSKDFVVLFQAAWGQTFLERIHAAHDGVEGSPRRARDSVFWPGTNAAIKDFREKCDICGSWRTHKQRREPLHQHYRPTRRWAKVGIDLSSLVGHPTKFLIFRRLLVELLWSRRAKENWCHSRYLMPSKAVSNAWGTGWSDLWQWPPFSVPAVWNISKEMDVLPSHDKFLPFTSKRPDGERNKDSQVLIAHDK